MEPGQINSDLEHALNRRVLDLRAILLRLTNSEVSNLRMVSKSYNWMIESAALYCTLEEFDLVIDKLIADHLEFGSNNRIKTLARHYNMPCLSRSDHTSRITFLKELRRKFVASRSNCPEYKLLHREVDEIFNNCRSEAREEAVRAFIRGSTINGMSDGGSDISGGWYTTFGSIEEGEGSAVGGDVEDIRDNGIRRITGAG